MSELRDLHSSLGFAHLVKAEHAHLTPEELLELPVSALQGVDGEDVSALAGIDVRTVHDLALSRVFGLALVIFQTADDEGAVGPWGIGLGRIARDAVDPVASLNVADLETEDIQVLRDLTVDQADELKRTIATMTLRDLALWPPYVNARAVLTAAVGVRRSSDEDRDEVPDELVPVMKSYATDRLSYRRIYYDHELGPEFVDTASLARETPLFEELSRRPIDVTDDLAAAMPFPGVGSVVQVVQEWIPEGLSLGSLLHSVALAPGESTRVAVLDWSRRETAATEDVVSQRESIAASRRDHRALTEVQSGTVKEAYGERTRTDFETESEQEGESVSSSGLGALFRGSGGFSWSEAETEGWVESVGSSWGERDVGQEMTQEIHQASQQAASSVRSSRATVVTETAQGEEIEARTRMVTNYNHMHPLSIHYYEVVQIYRVITRPSEVRPVLFVPFNVVDFLSDGAKLLGQYRHALMRAALDDYTRGLLREAAAKVDWHVPLESWPYDPTNNRTARRTAAGLARVGIEGHRWARRYSIPEDIELRGVQMAGDGDVDEVRIKLDDSDQEITIPITSSNFHPLSTNIRVSEIERITVHGRFRERDDSPTRLISWLWMTNGSRYFGINNYSWVDPDDEPRDVTLIEAEVPVLNTELFEILDENRLHYSQAIWRAMRPSDLHLRLSSRSLGRVPVTRLIDTTPLATYGNLVAFPLNIPSSAEDEDATMAHLVEWWQKASDRGPKKHVARIPLGSGGVHAEAILGRANAAEKLDLTRFWDWQESPIPLVAPEIAPLELGSRARDVSARSQGLADALVGLQTAPDMPAPAGLEAMANILTASGIFSQLSSMATNAALASGLADNTSEGARAAAEQATEANRIASEMLTEAMRTAASLYAAANGVPPVGGGGAGQASGGSSARSRESRSNSGFGARLNAAERPSAGANGSRAGSTAGAGAAHGAGGGDAGARPDGSGGSAGRTVAPGGAGTAASSSRTDDLPRRMLEADMGMAASPQVVRAVHTEGGGFTGGAEGLALLVFLENGGSVDAVFGNLLDPHPGVKEYLERFIDVVAEGYVTTINRFSNARGRVYERVLILEDAIATGAQLESSLNQLADDGFLTDVITVGHGTTEKLIGFEDEVVSSEQVRQFASTRGSQLPIRSVFMINCKAASMNAAWQEAGARASAGSRGNNWIPVPMLETFWHVWTGGATFSEAVGTAYSVARRAWEPLYEVGRLVPAADVSGWFDDQKLEDSRLVVAGNGALSIRSHPAVATTEI